MSVELLQKSVNGFLSYLNSVDDHNWDSLTACDGWDVSALVDHMISGARMTVELLKGASKDEALAVFANLPTTTADRRAEIASAAAAHIEAFRAPGALDMIVHHPAMDMPSVQLLNFRIGDYLLHTWDLARAFGDDVVLDADVVQSVWDTLSPMAETIGFSGVFGEGPSGTVPETAPLQARLIDLSGRRV